MSEVPQYCIRARPRFPEAPEERGARETLTHLPGQWLQCQADGYNVCRVLRPLGAAGRRGPQHTSSALHGVPRT